MFVQGVETEKGLTDSNLGLQGISMYAGKAMHGFYKDVAAHRVRWFPSGHHCLFETLRRAHTCYRHQAQHDRPY